MCKSCAHLRHVADPISGDSGPPVSGHAPEDGDLATVKLTPANNAGENCRLTTPTGTKEAVTAKEGEGSNGLRDEIQSGYT